MHRFYPDPGSEQNGFACLTPEDARHAIKVLRLREGDHVEIVLNDLPWIAEIASVQGDRVVLRKLEPLPSTEPALRVTLFQGIPKADKMDWIVQKATELGVSEIVPLTLSRCVTRLDASDRIRKTDRWKKISREAGKQSGRCVIPQVHEPVSISGLTSSVMMPAISIVPWEGEKEYGPCSFHLEHPNLTSLGILIGPEGGISVEEINLLRDIGFLPVTLGKRILRTETAGLAALAAMMCLYGEMENA